MNKVEFNKMLKESLEQHLNVDVVADTYNKENVQKIFNIRIKFGRKIITETKLTIDTNDYI